MLKQQLEDKDKESGEVFDVPVEGIDEITTHSDNDMVKITVTILWLS